MLLALVLSLVAGQTIYEWVDSKGTSHFTDDPSTIPPNAKRKVTTGAELTVTPAAPRPDGGAVAAPAPRDTCAPALALVKDTERQLEQEKAEAAQADEKENQRCQDVLRLQGEPGYARCMAGREKPATSPQRAALEKRLEEAKDTLRRAQVGGCH
jgi:hypothetical protein